MMKKVLVLVMVLLFPIPICAQEGEIMILSERVGEKIDVQERNYYKLWGDIKGFQSAVFLQTEEGCIAKVTYVEDGQKKVLSQRISVGRFRWFGEYIDHFEEIEAGTYELKAYEVDRQPAIEPSGFNFRMGCYLGSLAVLYVCVVTLFALGMGIALGG
jgi:hypothetical protein